MQGDLQCIIIGDVPREWSEGLFKPFTALYNVPAFQSELNAPFACVIAYHLPPTRKTCGATAPLQSSSGQRVECVDCVNKQLQHNVSSLNLSLYHVNHTVYRIHRWSSAPKAVLSISRIRTVIREMSRDPGGNNSFENFPHVTEKADRYIHRKRCANPPEFGNMNRFFFLCDSQVISRSSCIL